MLTKKIIVYTNDRSSEAIIEGYMIDNGMKITGREFDFLCGNKIYAEVTKDQCMNLLDVALANNCMIMKGEA